MSHSKPLVRIAAATALVLGGSLAAAGPAQASAEGTCYSFNRDTAACGWHGSPAPSTGTCSGGVALAAWGAFLPFSWGGLISGAASGAFTLATSCDNVIR